MYINKTNLKIAWKAESGTGKKGDSEKRKRRGTEREREREFNVEKTFMTTRRGEVRSHYF